MRTKQRKGYVDRTREFSTFMSAEYVVTESGLPVIPDSYGTNSALVLDKVFQRRLCRRWKWQGSQRSSISCYD